MIKRMISITAVISVIVFMVGLAAISDIGKGTTYGRPFVKSKYDDFNGCIIRSTDLNPSWAECLSGYKKS